MNQITAYSANCSSRRMLWKKHEKEARLTVLLSALLLLFSSFSWSVKYWQTDSLDSICWVEVCALGRGEEKGRWRNRSFSCAWQFLQMLILTCFTCTNQSMQPRAQRRQKSRHRKVHVWTTMGRVRLGWIKLIIVGLVLDKVILYGGGVGREPCKPQN